MTADVLGIGLAGKQLTPLEKTILAESSPYAVLLFGRNIHGPQHLRDLVAEAKSVSRRPPLFMIDEEGGRVDRLRNLIPGLPSAEAFEEKDRPAELSERFGRVIGIALRYFDIEINLAPVVDIRGEVAPKGLERRTFGSDPETVVELAGAFIRGLHSAGVASCPKHWPGIGAGSGDSHYGATVIDVPLQQLVERELVPFQHLVNESRAVMVSHGSYPQIDEAELPATLSWRITTDLLRNVLHFDGLAVSDDMEMHAVSDLGPYEELTDRALLAGNDVILFCSHIERIPDLQRHLARRVSEDERYRARFDEAIRRCEAYRAHCDQLRAAAPPVPTFADVVDEAARFVEEFERTRPHGKIIVPEVDRRKGSRNPRTGREEWT
jgi:beta-N-acetylhexosaminidase